MDTETKTNVGDLMKSATQKTVKVLVLLAFAVAYVAGVMYAEVHGFTMLSAGVKQDLLPFAIVGMVALGVMALAFPLALHFWTFELSRSERNVQKSSV